MIGSLSPSRARERSDPDQREEFDQRFLAAQTKGIQLKLGVLNTVFRIAAATPRLQIEKTKYLKRLREQGAHMDPLRRPGTPCRSRDGHQIGEACLVRHRLSLGAVEGEIAGRGAVF